MVQGITAAVALIIGTVVCAACSAQAAISDIVSDFLYYQEELKIKAPAKALAEVVTGIGERYLGLVDVAGAVRVWDLESGGQVAVEGRKPPQARAIFLNERHANFIVAETDGRVYETAGMSFSERGAVFAAGVAIDAIAVSRRAPTVVAAGGGQLHVYNLETKLSSSSDVQQRVTQLCVSDDGRFVAYKTGAATWVFDTDRKRSLPLEPVGRATKVRFYYDSAGTLGLVCQDSPSHLTFYKYDGRTFSKSGEHKFSTAPEDFWVRSDRQLYWTNKNVLRVSTPGTGGGKTVFEGKEPIVYVCAVKAGDNLLIVQRSSLIVIWSGADGKMVATAISTENGWAVIDSKKRYDGSALGGREVSWVIQQLSLDLEKFSKHFYEPGLLLYYVGQQPVALASTGHQGPIPTPPTITEVKLLENVAGSGRNVVLATARNIKEDVADIEVYHNGKRVAPSARIADEAKRQEDMSFRSVGFEIQPLPGPNTVAVMGVGRLGIEGPTKELTFHRAGAATGALRAMAVGIDQYAEASLKLGYAKHDAETIAKLMQSSKGFAGVSVSELYNDKADREAILSHLQKLATAAQPGDTLIIYLAGHGIAMRGDWYYLSASVARIDEGEIVRRSISAGQIATTLRDSKASHIVIMVDACNSGGLVKDIKGLLQNRVYTQFGRETGFAVLAASRQDKNAMERATLGHGVFTAALMSALSGAADRNSDGRITARELVAYVSRQIPILATEHLNEIQVPVSYAPGEDFVVRVFR